MPRTPAAKSKAMAIVASAESFTVPDPLDPWMTVHHGYALNKVYAKASDGRGHSDNVQVPMSPAIVGQLRAIAGNPNLPWRSVQDFIRDATTHRLKYVHDSGDIDTRGLAELHAHQSIIDEVRNYRMMIDDMIGQQRVEIAELVRIGHLSTATEIIDSAQQLAESWSDAVVAERLESEIRELRRLVAEAIKERGRARRKVDTATHLTVVDA